MKIFLSGPMTGIADFNFPAFNDAEQFLNQLGYQVVNPVNICRRYKKERVLSDKAVFDKMIRDELDELVTCDMVCLLPGFENSTGALKELSVAVKNNIGFTTYETLTRIHKLCGNKFNFHEN